MESILQQSYEVPNFFTKVNLLLHLFQREKDYQKVVVFVKNKRVADALFEQIQLSKKDESIALIHSNKSQNFRLQAIKGFQDGDYRILIATDILARGIDIEGISHVINFDMPKDAENYIHRIGRTGRAAEEGNALTFITPQDEEAMTAITELMDREVPVLEFPAEVLISTKMTEEELPKEIIKPYQKIRSKEHAPGPAYHEKKDKNKKTNQGGSYRRELAKKYKKPKTRGQKRK